MRQQASGLSICGDIDGGAGVELDGSGDGLGEYGGMV